MASLIKVTLKRSFSKLTEKEVGTLRGLGLVRRGQTKILKDTVPNRGAALKMQHMLDIERIDGPDSLRTGARVARRAQKGA